MALGLGVVAVLLYNGAEGASTLNPLFDGDYGRLVHVSPPELRRVNL
jgi:hypothetical protein